MTDDAKRAAIELIRTEYRQMDALFRSLDAAQLERPVFTGEGPGWRVRDLPAHFAYWQTLAARCGEEMARGRQPAADQRIRSFLGIVEELDEMNGANFAAWRGTTVETALDHLRAANERLVAALQALPAERVLSGEGPGDLHRYFWQPGLNHLHQHRAHIEAALKETQTP